MLLQAVVVPASGHVIMVLFSLHKSTLWHAVQKHFENIEARQRQQPKLPEYDMTL